MAIRTRISGLAERAELKRKAKGRHPYLKLGSSQNAVFQTILQDGNPAGGITAARVEAMCGYYHPQIMKNLLDYKLITQISKSGNEFKYIADPAARGTYMQDVTINVELLEDENGQFFCRAKVHGGKASHAKIVRVIGSRKIHFKVPLLGDPSIMNVTQDIELEEHKFTVPETNTQNTIIDVTANEVIDEDGALLLLPSYAIV